MPRHYLYLPFTKWKEDKAFKEARNHYEWRYGKAAKGTTRNKQGEGHSTAVIQGGRGIIGPLSKPLKVVKNDDVLVIMGHGDWGDASTLSVNRVKKTVQFWKPGVQHWVDMTVDDLADQLKSEGLGTGHRLVKLISCWGGTADQHRYDDSTGSFLTAKSRTSCTAALLAMALGQRNYGNIVVGGFNGMGGMHSDETLSNTVGFEYEGGAPSTAPEPDKWIGTKGNVFWYGSDGKMTTR